MRTLAASAAEKDFGALIDMAQREPVCLQSGGQDVAVVMSLEEFRRLSESSAPQVNSSVDKLHAESVERWGKVYEALAK